MPGAEAAGALLTAGAVRERCNEMLALGLDGELDHFDVDTGRLAVAAGLATDATREAYPGLDVPLHARWRHFEADGLDRWGMLAGAAAHATPAERARAAFDLAIVSVLLDAGAGSDWRYHEHATAEIWARSEGLAIASLAMFASGLFSGEPRDPLRADARALAMLGEDELAAGLQVGPDNPIAGLAGRLELLKRLGATVAARPEIFAREDDPRPGGLFDHLAAEAAGGPLPAPRILEILLDALGPVWPGRIVLAGVDLGDTWRHPKIGGEGPAAGLVPFHKLSQWLAYSLIEPLADAGIEVVDMDGLTGLAEYRNGGLFVDTGVLRLRDSAAASLVHDVGSPLVVEWRALTVALLDRTAEAVRAGLGFDAASLPLARVLQGGTWAAGRRIARERRADGGPPIRVASDGTVF